MRPRVALALTVVLAASLVAGWLVFVRLVLLGHQPEWDEAAHALQGALIAHDLRALDLMSLLFDSYRQVWWPPMHSWLVGGAFLIAGPSIEAARAVSMLAFMLLAPTAFLVARTVEPRHGILAGSVSATLALTSPGLIAFAAKSMLELPGLLALCCTMLVYCTLERHPDARPRTYALLGLCTVLTYLVKTNYGILLIISIVLTKLIVVGFRPRRLLTKKNFYAVLPLAVFGAIWFAYPPKVVSTWNALVNEASGQEARGLLGLLFYPRAIVHLSGSWWMSLLLWGGLVTAWRERRQPGIGFLAVLALTQFVIGEFHHTKADRHVLTMFPAMFVLAGVAAARLWSWLGLGGRGGRVAAIGLLASVAVLHAVTLGRRDWFPAQARQATEVLQYISTLTRENAPTLVLGTREAWPGPPAIDWHLVGSERLLPVTAAGSAMDPRQERRLAGAIGGVRVPERLHVSAQRVLGRYDAPSGTRSLHVGDRLPEDQVQFDIVLERTLVSDPPRAVLAMIAISDTTRYPTSFIAPGLARAGFREVSMREFPRAGTRVYLYRRP
ncbi:MAG: ArnT family glycosyltransferase [Gemmatimonadota bacterium]